MGRSIIDITVSEGAMSPPVRGLKLDEQRPDEVVRGGAQLCSQLAHWYELIIISSRCLVGRTLSL